MSIKKISQLTDAELLEARLQLTDPYAQEDLVWHIPPGSEIVDIENFYRLEKARWDEGEKVWCAKCCAKRHRKGFTALLSNDQRALLGSTCGKEEFGDSWDQLVKGYGNVLSRARFLQRLHNDHAPKLKRLLELLPGWAPAAATIQRSRAHFANELPTLFQRLEEAILRDGGRLRSYERVRDIIGEAKQDPNTGRGSDRTRIEETVVHEIEGQAFIVGVDLHYELRAALDAIRGVLELSESTDTVTDIQGFKKKIDSLNRRLRKLRQLPEQHAAAEAFFRVRQLTIISRWATKENGVVGSFHAEGRRIIWNETNRCAEVRGMLPSLDLTVMELLPAGDPIADQEQRIAV